MIKTRKRELPGKGGSGASAFSEKQQKVESDTASQQTALAKKTCEEDVKSRVQKIVEERCTDENTKLYVLNTMRNNWQTVEKYEERDWLVFIGLGEDVAKEIVSIIRSGKRSELPSNLYSMELLSVPEKLKYAFQSPYVGSVDPLSQQLNDLYKLFKGAPHTFYAPCTALVQSSGTGKTRATAELAKSRYVIYVCLRPADATGFPLRSPENVIRELSNMSGDPNTAFFQAAVAVIGVLIDAVGDHSHENWNQFFKEVVRKAKKKYSQEETHVVTPKQRTYFSSNKLYELLALDRYASGGYDFATCFWEAVISCKNSGVFGDWKSSDNEKPEPLLFVFDEARALLPSTGGDPTKSPLNLLRRTFMLLVEMFAILLDSSARVNNFTTQAIKEPSSRIPQGGSTLLDPIIHQIPMDRCAATLPKTLAEVCDSDRLLCLGRPLWDRNSIGRSHPSRWVLVVNLAINKLGLTDKAMSEAYAMAMLGPRVQLSTKLGYTLAQDLAADRLWCILAINDARDSLSGMYWSEPAVVAACFEFMGDKKRMVAALNKVTPMLVRFQDDVGQLGEFVARIVLVLAWDEMVRSGSSSITKPFQPQSVGDLLERIVGPVNLEQFPTSDHVWVNRILNGQMVFTHFAPCDRDLNAENEHLLLGLIRRGAGGYFVKPNHPYIDLVIPFVLGGKSTRLTEKTVSCILIQVKNWAEPGANQWENELLNHCSRCVPDKRTAACPVISMLFLTNHPKPETFISTNKFSLDIVIRDISSVAYLKGAKEIVSALKQLCTDKTDVEKAIEEISVCWTEENLR